MSVGLSRCEVGDKVKTANGEIGVVVRIDYDPTHYPLLIGINNKEWWYGNDGVRAGCWNKATNIVEVFPKQTEHVKPPLGLMPRNIWIEGRVTDVIDTLSRFRDTPKNIKIEWIRELTELLEELD